MVEKEETSYDSASTVMVDAIETHPSNTVGAAIAILEEKLAAKGISFQVPAGTSKSDLGKVDGKLLRLPMLIELAITHAIDTIEKATEKNVSEKVTGSVLLKRHWCPVMSLLLVTILIISFLAFLVASIL